MARPRFSEMLFDRRRQLGLSVDQVSRNLRLKPQVIEAFEEGDFLSIPKSGYAQGMLASYARYLGLNTRVIVSQFMHDLAEFNEQDAVRSTYGESAAQDALNTTNRIVVRTPRDYRGKEGLLPTTGGYAGDMHDYATTSQVRSRQTGNTVPIMPQRHYGRINPHTALEQPAHMPSARTSRLDTYVPATSQRRFTSSDAYHPNRSYTPSRTQADRAGRDPRTGAPSRMPLGRDTVQTRDISNAHYVDDLRFDNAYAYESASSPQGRVRSRNIANVKRPSVHRQQSRRPQRQARRNNSPRTAQDYLFGILTWFVATPRRLMVLLSVLVAIFITVLLIVSVTSCVNNNLSGAKTVQVASNTQPAKPSSETVATPEAEEEAQKAAKNKAEQEQQAAQQKTTVDVSVAEGEVSWVEIVHDGKSVIAQQVTGPWTQSYDVQDAITIQVSNPSAVRVTKNGEPVKFDTKTAGIGTVTIKGTKPKDDQQQDGDASGDKQSGKADEKQNAESSNKKHASKQDSKQQATSNGDDAPAKKKKSNG